MKRVLRWVIGLLLFFGGLGLCFWAMFSIYGLMRYPATASEVDV